MIIPSFKLLPCFRLQYVDALTNGSTRLQLWLLFLLVWIHNCQPGISQRHSEYHQTVAIWPSAWVFVQSVDCHGKWLVLNRKPVCEVGDTQSMNDVTPQNLLFRCTNLHSIGKNGKNETDKLLCKHKCLFTRFWILKVSEKPTSPNLDHSIRKNSIIQTDPMRSTRSVQDSLPPHMPEESIPAWT